MSVSFGIFRRAVREPTFRNEPGGSPPITPISTFRKAVRVYHREGVDRALASPTLTSPHWRLPGRGRTLANNYRDCLQRYIALDALDARTFVDAGITETVVLGNDEVNVVLDVILLNRTGHVGRVLLWDTSILDRRLAQITAAPALLALQQLVGESRAQTIEIWHLRSGTQFEFTAHEALAELPEAVAAVQRVA